MRCREYSANSVWSFDDVDVVLDFSLEQHLCDSCFVFAFDRWQHIKIHEISTMVNGSFSHFGQHFQCVGGMLRMMRVVTITFESTEFSGPE